MPRFGAAAASVEKDGETLELQVKRHVGLNRLVFRSGLAGYAACCAFSLRPVARAGFRAEGKMCETGARGAARVH